MIPRTYKGRKCKFPSGIFVNTVFKLDTVCITSLGMVHNHYVPFPTLFYLFVGWCALFDIITYFNMFRPMSQINFMCV